MAHAVLALLILRLILLVRTQFHSSPPPRRPAASAAAAMQWNMVTAQRRAGLGNLQGRLDTQDRGYNAGAF